MHHLSPALSFFVLHNISLHFFPSYLLSLPVLISPHPLLSPSHVFILFCRELCYDKDFTPRMYAVSACVMPLWGMGALTALPAPPGPALPKQRGLGKEGLEEGGGGDSCPHPVLSCLALMETSRTHIHNHTNRQRIARFTRQDFFLSLLFSWTVEIADMRLPGIVHFPVSLLLPHSYNLQNGSGLFTIHQEVPQG